MASMMRRPLTPSRSLATDDSFKLAVSNRSRISPELLSWKLRGSLRQKEKLVRESA